MNSFHPVRDSHSYISTRKQKSTQSLTGFQKRVYPVRKFRKKIQKNRKTRFSNGVYEVVKKIPLGKVLNYKEVAKLAGFPRAWRAVGNILNKNTGSRISCHRVIRSNGKVGGYRRGTKKKITLLKKEGITINSYGKITP